MRRVNPFSVCERILEHGHWFCQAYRLRKRSCSLRPNKGLTHLKESEERDQLIRGVHCCLEAWSAHRLPCGDHSANERNDYDIYVLRTSIPIVK